MTTITMTLPENSLREEIQEEKVNKIGNKLRKSLQEKKRSFDIWRIMAYNNIVSTVKNNPWETLAIVTGSTVVVEGGQMLYKILQDSKPKSEINIVIGDKTDSTEAEAQAKYDDTYIELPGTSGNDNTNPNSTTVKQTNPDTTAIVDEKVNEIKIKEHKEAITGIDGNPFKIKNGKLIFTDNSADVAQTNIHEAIKFYNNIKMTNVYKNISFSAIQVILNDETLTDNEKRDAITIIFELSMKQFGYMLSRIGGADDGEWNYEGDITYIEQTIKQLKSPNASIDNIAYFNTHEYLNEYNLTYKANYKRAKELFNAGAGSICGKIAIKNKLTADESNAYLMDAYFGWVNAPQTWTTKAKRDFLGLYFDDISWNNATAGRINQKFSELMRKARKYMKTDGSLKDTPMPQKPVSDLSSNASDFDI